jgi:hypothetical protein
MTRDFEDILERSRAPLSVTHDSPAALGGLFRHLLLREDERAAARCAGPDSTSAVPPEL